MKTRRSWLSISLLLVFAAGLRAQSSGQATGQQPAPAPSQPPAPSPAPPKKKPKRVWTNEDVGSISGGVSVVGDSSPAEPGWPQDKKTYARGQASASNVAAFRKELQNLRGQLDQVDKQISDLRNFKADNTSPSGGIKMGGRYNMVPLEEQVRQLEQKRKQIQARIDDVEDQARKMSIEPGDLR